MISDNCWSRWPLLLPSVLKRASASPRCALAAFSLVTALVQARHTSQECNARWADAIIANKEELQAALEAYSPTSCLILHHKIEQLLLQVASLDDAAALELCVQPLLGLAHSTSSSGVGPQSIVRVLHLLISIAHTPKGRAALVSAGAAQQAVALMVKGNGTASSSFLSAHVNVRCAALELGGLLCESTQGDVPVASSTLQQVAAAVVESMRGTASPEVGAALCSMGILVSSQQGAKALLLASENVTPHPIYKILVDKTAEAAESVDLLRPLISSLLNLVQQWQHPGSVRRWIQFSNGGDQTLQKIAANIAELHDPVLADDGEDTTEALISDIRTLWALLQAATEDDSSGLEGSKDNTEQAHCLVEKTRIPLEDFLADVIFCTFVGATKREGSAMHNEEAVKRPRLSGANDFDTAELGYR